MPLQDPRSSCSEGFFQGAVVVLALLCLARLLVELAQMVKLVANLGFETPRHWLIPPLLGDIFREVVLSRCVRVRFVMRVAVVLLVTELLLSCVGALRRCSGTGRVRSLRTND